MKRLLIVCLALILVSGIVLACGGGGGSVSIREIERNPHQWEGKQVTIEGYTDAGVFGDEFAIIDYEGARIAVKYAGNLPNVGMGDRVKVTGIVRIDRSWDFESVYISAQSWKYIN